MIRNFLNTLWDILCSVKVTIFLLILLAFSSVFGTLIPQNEGAIQFAERMSPGLGRIFYSLQLFDLYHSIWFRSIILCLVFNLIVCSINRLFYTLRLFSLKPKPDRSKPFENLPAERDIKIERDPKEIIAKGKKILKRKYANLIIKHNEEGAYIRAEKGRYSIFGVYLVHLSVLFILIGAIVGSLYGFKGYIDILEGGSADTVVIRDIAGHRHLPLEFVVHCDKFSIDFYTNGLPKEYRSNLRFTTGNQDAYKGLLRVNHPIKFKGITFYQASYGSTTGESAEIRIHSIKNPRSPLIKKIKIGTPVPLPRDEGDFILTDLRDDFMNMGPAVSILIRPSDGEEKRIWLFKHHVMIKKHSPGFFNISPKFNPSIYEPYTFYLNEIELKTYTVLQVNKDPGIPFVYSGFLIIIIGLFITFFTSHRRIWVRFVGEGNITRVQVAGTSNKNPVGLERELDQLSKHLKRGLEITREEAC